jgi:tRNA-splicing ligase RtcB
MERNPQRKRSDCSPKGATPANENELGMIPGSMTAKGFIVRGKGNPDSLNSASHGAGRAHSRGECRSLFTQHDIKKELKLKNVTLMGGMQKKHQWLTKTSMK